MTISIMEYFVYDKNTGCGATAHQVVPGVLDHGLEHLSGRHHRLPGDIRAADHVLLGQKHLSLTQNNKQRGRVGGGGQARQKI